MSPETFRAEVRAKEVKQIVRAVLVTMDGLVCVGKRSPGYEGGKWCLVGGKAEGPVLSQELLREITEETGVSVGVLFDDMEPVFVTCLKRHRHGKVWENNYFILELDDEAIPGVLASFARDEYSEIRFVDAKGTRGLRFAFGDGEMVRAFFKYVGN